MDFVKNPSYEVYNIDPLLQTVHYFTLYLQKFFTFLKCRVLFTENVLYFIYYLKC